MAKNRTEKSCYQSRFGGGWISRAQYLAEYMCERTANYQKVELPPFFWRLDKWKKEFLKQVNLVTGYLADYEDTAILAALRRPEASRVFSFGFKAKLEPLFLEEQKKIFRQKENIKQEEKIEIDINATPRPQLKTNNLQSKLRGL